MDSKYIFSFLKNLINSQSYLFTRRINFSVLNEINAMLNFLIANNIENLIILPISHYYFEPIPNLINGDVINYNLTNLSNIKIIILLPNNPKIIKKLIIKYENSDINSSCVLNIDNNTILSPINISNNYNNNTINVINVAYDVNINKLEFIITPTINNFNLKLQIMA